MLHQMLITFVNAGVPDGASDTLGHISKAVGLNVPNMAKIGLGNIPSEKLLLRLFQLKAIQQDMQQNWKKYLLEGIP